MNILRGHLKYWGFLHNTHKNIQRQIRLMNLSLILSHYYLSEWRKQFFVNVAALSIFSFSSSEQSEDNSSHI